MDLQQRRKRWGNSGLIGEIKAGNSNRASVGAQVRSQELKLIDGSGDQQKIPTLTGQLFCGSPTEASTCTSNQSCRQPIFANRRTLRGFINRLRRMIENTAQRPEFPIARLA